MNIILEKPITSKESYDDENDIIKYGQSIIQTSKNTIEISIMKETQLNNQDKNILLFGLFDGHNGPEVSKYLSIHFSQFLSENSNFINGNYSKALEETFINLDYSFRALEVQLELSKYNINKEQNTVVNKKDELFFDFLDFFDPRNLEGVNVAEFCGSCGIVILITEKDVFIANAGNSKCIPVNIKNEIIEDNINREHSIEDEYEIERLNRIFGINNDDKNIITNNDKIFNDFPLYITRGFGDLQLKDNKLINIEDQYISIKPDIIKIPIDDLNYLIIGNYGCFSKDKNILSLEKFFLDKYNKSNGQQKISEIIEIFFDEKFKEMKKSENKEVNINNYASIIIELKHENNFNNININEEKDDIHETKESSNQIYKSDDEDDNL